jgi:hypothetical protein
MQKPKNYAHILKQTPDWEPYLLAESGLPGPRANLELIQAVADQGTLEQYERWLAIPFEQAPGNSAPVFLSVCAVVGLGRLLAQGRLDLLERLRSLASDPRWRIREAVAMALQRFGQRDMPALLQAVQPWVAGNLLEMRAAAAALCEPALLTNEPVSLRVLETLQQITRRLVSATDRRSDDFRVLRQALGYCWSVAVAANPEGGKCHLERLALDPDPDVRWIVRENLKKNRLLRMDAAWVESLRRQLG